MGKTSEARMAMTPATGAKMMRLSKRSMFFPKLVNQEVDSDHDERAEHGGVEVILDSSRLEQAQAAARADDRVGEKVHRAVHQVLVDRPVDVSEEAADGGNPIDCAVDYHVVEHRQRSRQQAGRAQPRRLVDLVDVVLVVDKAVETRK